MTHSHKRGEWHKEFACSMISGVLYGSTSIAVGHPFDTIKTKMQAQHGYIESGGFLGSFWKVLKTEGLRGLYRGWLPPLWGSSVYRSIQFAIFEALYTKWDSPTMQKAIPYSGGLQLRVVAAGIVASTSRAIVECPVEYAKVKRQTGQSWFYKDMYNAFPMQWMRTGGLMTSYFMMIDSVRRHTNMMDTRFGQFLASGLCASIGFWIVWPFETLKNQLQAEIKDVGGNTKERLRYLVEHHGIQGLFRGIVPGTASIFLRNGAAMVMMQWSQKKLTELGLRDQTLDPDHPPPSLLPRKSPFRSLIDQFSL